MRNIASIWDRLTTPSSKQLDSWSRTRVKGRKHFILHFGIYYWATLMFVTLELVPAAYQYFTGTPPHTFSASKLIAGLIVWPISGYFFGSWTWAASESRFSARRREGGQNLDRPPDS